MKVHSPGKAMRMRAETPRAKPDSARGGRSTLGPLQGQGLPPGPLKVQGSLNVSKSLRNPAGTQGCKTSLRTGNQESVNAQILKPSRGSADCNGTLAHRSPLVRRAPLNSLGSSDTAGSSRGSFLSDSQDNCVRSINDGGEERAGQGTMRVWAAGADNDTSSGSQPEPLQACSSSTGEVQNGDLTLLKDQPFGKTSFPDNLTLTKGEMKDDLGKEDGPQATTSGPQTTTSTKNNIPRKHRRSLKSKGNVRPSTAVRKHVKKISEEFSLKQSKYESALHEGNTRPQVSSSASSISSMGSLASSERGKGRKVRDGGKWGGPDLCPQNSRSKVPRTIVSNISCSKCEAVSGKGSNSLSKTASTTPSTTLTTTSITTVSASTSFFTVSSSRAGGSPSPIRGKGSSPNPNSGASPRRRKETSLSPAKKMSPSTLTYPPTHHHPPTSPKPRLKSLNGGHPRPASDSQAALGAPSPCKGVHGRRISNGPSSSKSPPMTFEQIRKAKLYAEKAIREGRVFSMWGNFPAVREALRQRGWLEKVLTVTPYVNPHPNACLCPQAQHQQMLQQQYNQAQQQQQQQQQQQESPASGNDSAKSPNTNSISSPRSPSSSSSLPTSSPRNEEITAKSASSMDRAALDQEVSGGEGGKGKGGTEGSRQDDPYNHGTPVVDALHPEDESLPSYSTSPSPPPPSAVSSPPPTPSTPSPIPPTEAEEDLETIISEWTMKHMKVPGHQQGRTPADGSSPSSCDTSCPNSSSSNAFFDASCINPSDIRQGLVRLVNGKSTANTNDDDDDDEEPANSRLCVSQSPKPDSVISEDVESGKSVCLRQGDDSNAVRAKTAVKECDSACNATAVSECEKNPVKGESENEQKITSNQESSQKGAPQENGDSLDATTTTTMTTTVSTTTTSTTSALDDTDFTVTDLDMPLVARLLRNIEPKLIWTWTRDAISFKHLAKDQLVNRFPHTPFTTKYGLCATVQQLHWFSEAAGVDTFVPRCYCIGHEDERTAFVHDYRTTACLNVLKWVSDAYYRHGPWGVAHNNGEVALRRVRQALAHVEQYIQSCCHDDLDAPPPVALKEHEWDALITAHYRLVHHNKRIKLAQEEQIEQLVRECESALERVVAYWPQLQMDGLRNLWIVKPGAQSRGRGIFLLNHLEDILALVQSPLIHETRYVVQKYMERPLLIHNTKFDIRQWFLVTDWNPLTVWMYKACYLRFCSREYDLSNRDEAVHLSNNAIQCKYLNGVRSDQLPRENMWDCQQFRQYLSAYNREEEWETIVYPGMRDALVCAMLAAQVEMDTFKHGFELFGADFMLTEDLRPWLIEINSSPCMAPTTSVTRRMCYQCLQDVIKVVVDQRQNKMADTGFFECVYRDSERAIPNPPYLGVNLQVVGRQIKKGVVRPERKKPKKLKSAAKLVKKLPLITLTLGETDDPATSTAPPTSSATTTTTTFPAHSPEEFPKHYQVLESKPYLTKCTGGSPSANSPGDLRLEPAGSSLEAQPRPRHSSPSQPYVMRPFPTQLQQRWTPSQESQSQVNTHESTEGGGGGKAGHAPAAPTDSASPLQSPPVGVTAALSAPPGALGGPCSVLCCSAEL